MVEPDNPADPVLTALAASVLMVWIKGSDRHTAELIRRFDRAPKPMYYQPAFLQAAWEQYLRQEHATEATVDPDAFIRWTYARALAHRQPRYAAMARRWGVTVTAEQVAEVKDAAGFEGLVAGAISARAA